MVAAVNGDACDCPNGHDAAVTRGLARLGPHLVPSFDCNTEEGHNEFSNRPCDCCRTHLAGERYTFAVLTT
jgi:hypothetical protein